jgi:hypothetical protein
MIFLPNRHPQSTNSFNYTLARLKAKKMESAQAAGKMSPLFYAEKNQYKN